MPEHAFAGFSAETMAFLADLAANNERAWFEAHKSVYTDVLLPEAQAFISALGAALRRFAPEVLYDTRTNGQGSLLRIYRDIRFSADKTPYNPYLRMIFWQGAAKRTANPAFFVTVHPEGSSVFVGEWQFSREALAAYREAVVDATLGLALEQAIAQVQAAGTYELGGAHYQRVPSGYDADHPRAELLKHNGLWAMQGGITPESVQSPELVETCAAHCQRMAPLFFWLVQMRTGM